jgi:hypothetical protein
MASALILATAFAVAIVVSLVGVGPPLALAVAAAIPLVLGFAWRPPEGLLAFALFILFYDTTAIYLGASIRRVDELAIPAIGLLALFRCRPRLREWFNPLREGGVALVVVAAVASSALNSVPLEIWFVSLALLLKVIAIFYIATWIDFQQHHLVGAARILLAVGVLVLAAGLVEALDSQAFQEALGLPLYQRPRGFLPSIKSIFDHPALFAWFMAFIGLYCYTGFVITRNRWLLVAGIAFSIGTFLSARRRAIIGGVVGLAVGFIHQLRSGGRFAQLARAWAPVAVSGMVLLIVFSPGLLSLYERTFPLPTETPLVGESPLPSLPSDGEGPGSAQARVALYIGSARIAVDHVPLGVGPGRYGSFMSRVEYSPVYREYGLHRVSGLRERNPRYVTDTFWPMILGELGILGLAGYLAFLGSAGVALWRLARVPSEAFMRVFTLGTLAIFAAAATESLATPMFVSPPRAYLVMAAVGAAVGLCQRRSAEVTLSPAGPPPSDPGTRASPTAGA